jgi:hypothetical protein
VTTYSTAKSEGSGHAVSRDISAIISSIVVSRACAAMRTPSRGKSDGSICSSAAGT